MSDGDLQLLDGEMGGMKYGLKAEKGEFFGLCDAWRESRVYGESGLGWGVMANWERRAVGEMDGGRVKLGSVVGEVLVEPVADELAVVCIEVGGVGGD